MGGELAAARGVSVPIDTALTFAFVAFVLALLVIPLVVTLGVVVVLVVVGTVYVLEGVASVVVVDEVLVTLFELEGRGTCTPFTMMVAMSGPWITTS
jgi:hypothetical protein